MFDVIRNQRGQATIEFLVIATLIFMLIFGAIDYWLVLVKLQNAEHLKNFYLDRARVTGYLSTTDRNNLTTSMNKLGFADVVITAPTKQVVRSLDSNPLITITITADFGENSPFMMDFFLDKGSKNQPFYITLSGQTYSEYVGD